MLGDTLGDGPVGSSGDGGLISIYKDLVLSYAVQGLVYADLSISYGISTNVGVDLVLGYGIKTMVQKDLVLGYAIDNMGAVSASFICDYAIRQMVSRDLTISYALGDVADIGSNVVDLEKALRAGVVSCLALPLAVDNTTFDKPTDGSAWARLHVLSNQPITASAGIGGTDLHSGLLQVDLNYPLRTGTADVSLMAKAVTDFMRPGRVLTHLGTSALIWSSGQPRNAEVDGYYRRSLTIYWQAHIDRPI